MVASAKNPRNGRAELGVPAPGCGPSAKPAAGQGCLRMAARPANKEDPPIVVETPPLWVTTPPLQPPAGKLIEISAQVFVPKPIAGSVDGLFVFDNQYGLGRFSRRGHAAVLWREARRVALFPLNSLIYNNLHDCSITEVLAGTV